MPHIKIKLIDIVFPVVAINKAMMEIQPTFAGKPLVSLDTGALLVRVEVPR